MLPTKFRFICIDGSAFLFAVLRFPSNNKYDSDDISELDIAKNVSKYDCQPNDICLLKIINF
jgi:hypothetical protein